MSLARRPTFALISSGLKPARLTSSRASVALRSEWRLSSRACRTTLVSTPRRSRSRSESRFRICSGEIPSSSPRSKRAVGDVAEAAQHQRIEELHAELPVAEPRLALPQALERPDVDEDGGGAPPLDVVGGAVLEDQPLVEGRVDQLEGEQRGVPEHRERPLEGPGQEGDPLVAEDGRESRLGPAVGRGLEALDQPRPHQLPGLLRGGEQAGSRERLEVGERRGAQAAMDLTGDGEDPAVVVAEGAADPSRLGAGRF